MERLRKLQQREHGQMAFLMILTLLVVFMFFAVAFDAGLWYFDHRTAQNQAESAVLAGVHELPQANSSLAAGDTDGATSAANTWLTRNNATACGPGCITYSDISGDGRVDTIRVAVERDSDGIFSALSGIDFVTISGAATARVGRASIANVMPWAVVPPDPDCDFGASSCDGDIDGDGVIGDGECNGSFDECPWGLNIERLIAFKVGGGGNTGIIDACGGGANGYTDCIEGEIVSGFFAEGETVLIGLQGGNLGGNTDSALIDRFSETNPNWQDCDIEATPDFDDFGYDPDGKAAGFDAWINPATAIPGCDQRLVVIPILASMPPQGGGSASLEVLGVATFGIAKWQREAPLSASAWGVENDACRSHGGGQPPADHFECGMVWGYLYRDVIPPGFLIEQISETENPLAPLLIALIE